MNNLTTSNVKEKDLMKRGLYAPISFVQEILNRIDIVDIINQYLPLKKKWHDYYTLCPFHTEKKASFTVTPTKQFYHCFWCGAHGSAIDFLMEYRQLSYPNTIRLLAKKAEKKIKHMNYYREDYFWWLNEIEEYKEAVAIILTAQERRFKPFLGKSYTAVTGLDPDEIMDDAFLPYGEVTWYEDEEFGRDYPVITIEDYEWSDREYDQEEIALASIDEVIQERFLEEIPEEERTDDRGEGCLSEQSNSYNDVLPTKVDIMEQERLIRKKEDEERKANLQTIQEELTLMEWELEKMGDWLESCNYRIQSESFFDLQPGDCGKVVLLLDAQDKTFTLIFWERKSRSLPNNLSDIHAFFTHTLTENVGYHAWINVFWNTKRLGWAAYIVLENKRILIGHYSQDFWRIPKWITQKCIEQSGYWFVTISDSYFLDKKELLNFFLEQDK